MQLAIKKSDNTQVFHQEIIAVHEAVVQKVPLRFYVNEFEQIFAKFQT